MYFRNINNQHFKGSCFCIVNCLENFELSTYFSSKYITILKSEVDTYVEVVPLALEFSRCVDFVSHDSGNGLLYIFHPFHHLGLPHKVHILDKRIIFLPERHLAARVLSAYEFNILCKMILYRSRYRTSGGFEHGGDYY